MIEYKIKNFHPFIYYFYKNNTVEYYYGNGYYYKLRFKKGLSGIGLKVIYK